MPDVDLFGDSMSHAFEDTFLDVSDEVYKRVLQDLLPFGPAWTRENDRLLTKVLCALSREPSRVEFQARRLIEEADPRTTQELLEDWERFLGLPEQCDNPPTTEADRRAAILAKLRRKVSPTPAYFQSIAEDLGYTGVTVCSVEQDPFTTLSVCTDSLRSGPWVHVWSIVTDQSIPDLDDTLMCLVELVKPQHTQVIYYLGIPKTV